MIVVMKAGAGEPEVNAVLDRIEEMGLQAHLSRGEQRTVVGVIGRKPDGLADRLMAMDGVERVVPILQPYKLASREFRPESSRVRVGAVEIGGPEIVVIAGPCSVESLEQLLETAQAVGEAGAALLRGGAFKPRTSPYAFQGLAEQGLKLLAQTRAQTGLGVVTEVLSPAEVELVAAHADMLQVGARNMQNFPLLREVGRSRRPVLLKRGLSATIEEWLMAAEYVMSEGNHQVVLCERGIRTFETATRNTLDLSAVPVVKERSHLPVVVDPSHGTGYWSLVAPMALAAVAAGADGLLVEVHPRPDQALSDGPQSLKPDRFAQMMEGVRAVARSVGRSVATAPGRGSGAEQRAFGA
ncbi:3-deoxy-7-phosphoheptulonate synthase [Limnochorda pilosa]|uniref:3-deoxy-7-phosphoheptulonate synthase n=1 Tax=Limnochorda pilosa TaxID=1555112 RepID=A0A0K2SKK9_LIMPI|nr:3-deoxy-7-phosphoheptulonate synthase [Limnochorda pilosa]BAS27630.1 3-deoxy-7-phosphoheptulonate synthase [Limnochorda pilosa]